MRSRFNPRSRAVLATIVVATAISTVAHASDSKYFNGAFCRVVFQFGSSSQQQFAEYRGNGSVANRNLVNPIDVGCPIVRDSVAGINGWDSLEIGYFDKSADAVQCNAFAGSIADGSLSFSQLGNSNNTAGTSWSKANMTFGNNGGSFADGFYWIRCVIPRAPDTSNMSGIAYYRIQEP